MKTIKTIKTKVHINDEVKIIDLKLFPVEYLKEQSPLSGIVIDINKHLFKIKTSLGYYILNRCQFQKTPDTLTFNS